MTDSSNEKYIPKSPEKLSESTTLDSFSHALDTIIESYSKVKRPPSEEAKKLFQTHFTTLSGQFESYKATPQGKKLITEGKKEIFDSQILIIDETFRDIKNFLEGKDDRKILIGIEHLKNKPNRQSIFTLLPDGYTKDGVITRETRNNIKIEIESGNFEHKMRAFLDGKTKTVPHFNLNTFNEHPTLIREFLSRPGSIIGIYEDPHTQMIAQKSPEFIKMINDILAKEYPDLFGMIQDKTWYQEAGLNFNKISTLLDIVEYYDGERRKIFINMMNQAEKGETEKSSQIYEKYFSGEEIGIQLLNHFDQSKLIHGVQKEVVKTIEKYDNNKYIYETIKNNQEARTLARTIFTSIPMVELEHLLGLLSTIEESAIQGNTEEIISCMNRGKGKDIDLRYRATFMAGLAAISNKQGEMGSKISQLYARIAGKYSERINIHNERNIIEKQETTENNNTSDVIRKAFPGNAEKQEQKQKEFSKFFNDTDIFGKTGEITIGKKILIERLEFIFDSAEGKEMMKKIKTSPDGKEIFKLLANGFSEQTKKQTSSLAEKGFDIQKWEDFQNTHPIESAQIFAKLGNTQISKEEKRAILKEYLIDDANVLKNTEEFDLLIKEILKLKSTKKASEKYTDPQSIKDFSASWISGDFTEFNKITQERADKKEQEAIKKQEESESGKKEIVKTDAIIPFNTYTTFVEIPIGQPMISGSGNNTVFIHKNPDNTMSIYSPSGKMSIDRIHIVNKEEPFEDIEKAMNSIQFLKESGLNVFRNDLQKIIDAVNNRVSRGTGNQINLTDGINTEEGFILLETIGKITQEKVEIKTRDDTQLNALKRQFSTEGGGLLSKLQNTGYAKSDQIDIQKITEYIKTRT